LETAGSSKTSVVVCQTTGYHNPKDGNINTHRHVCIIRQGEIRNRKYKRLKHGSGEAYDRSSDQTVVVA
jgi:hypothetical protein